MLIPWGPEKYVQMTSGKLDVLRCMVQH